MNSSALCGPPDGAVQSRLPAQVQQVMLSGNRLHLQHGPINLVIKAIGSTAGVQQAYALAAQRMEGMLQGLVDNLSLLRSPLFIADNTKINDATSQRMVSTVRQFRDCFVTPMAAVAGAVADEVLAAMKNADGLDSVFVNNGGDIALHLEPGQKMRIGIVPFLSTATLGASVEIAGEDGVCGIATSGWDGHSMSLGIADAVTVLAKNAAIADTVATLIANKVDCDAECIDRSRALDIDPDSDLGERLVTVNVGALHKKAIDDALDRGAKFARTLIKKCELYGVFIYLQGHSRSLGWPYEHKGVDT
ncbi:MAG: UPF0280 family protein [Woeseiaceae bacterium]|nr:UPF0280 family protein [Woeseiaceae bacterium]